MNIHDGIALKFYSHWTCLITYAITNWRNCLTLHWSVHICFCLPLSLHQLSLKSRKKNKHLLKRNCSCYGILHLVLRTSVLGTSSLTTKKVYQTGRLGDGQTHPLIELWHTTTKEWSINWRNLKIESDAQECFKEVVRMAVIWQQIGIYVSIYLFN